MNNYKQLIFLGAMVLWICAPMQAQNNKVALSLYKKLGYKVSIPKFQETEGVSQENMSRIANSYRLNHDTENAEFWYSNVVEKSNKSEDFLYYAQALQSNEKYDKAKEYYLKYNEMVGGESADQRGALLAASIDRISSFKHTSVEVKNEEILNTEKLDFSPAYYNDELIFVSTRDHKKLRSGIKDIWIDDNFMALWKAGRNEDGSVGTPEVFSEKITTKFHEGPLVFNNSGDRVFFTRNDFKRGLRRNNSKGIMKLQIYTSTKEDGDWSKPQSLSINTKEYEEAHPAITPDGNKLYFTSDRKGGYGGMDLYVTEFKNGTWSAARNLGDKINTKGNDVFPYVHHDGTLYFASNGWEGLGGLDIYEAKVDGSGAMVRAENIGTPFNSPMDDFSLVMNELKSEGYFTSARDGGLGEDDIYSFKMTGKVAREATICAYEEGTNKRLEDVEVTINDPSLTTEDHVLKLVETNERDEYILKFQNTKGENSDESQTMFTDKLGVFNMAAEPNMEYNFIAKKEGYKVANETMTVSNVMLNSGYEFCIAMAPTNCLILEGIVKNKKYKNMIPNAKVTMVNKCTGDEVVVTSDANGDFNFPCVDCDCEYYLKGEKTYFTQGTNTATTMGLNCSTGGKVEVLLELTPYDPSKPAPSSLAPAETPSFGGNKIVEGAVIELPQIYYDFDQFYIRDDASQELDRVVSLMNQYPTLTIELGSHTDARGTTKYNENLSQNRADAAVKYIVSKGINSARLVAKGYGESQLRNKCANFVECPEDEHQYNRRTEVRVLRFNDPNTDVKYLGNMPIKIDRADPNRKWIWN